MISWAEIEIRMKSVPTSRVAEEFIRYEGNGLNQNPGFYTVIGASNQKKNRKKRVDISWDHIRWFKEAKGWLIDRVSAIGRV